MSWIAVAVALLGLIVAFLTHNPGVLFMALATTVLGLFAAIFLFAQARIESVSRPSVYTPTPEEIAAIRRAAEARRASEQAPALRRNAVLSTQGGEATSDGEE